MAENICVYQKKLYDFAVVSGGADKNKSNLSFAKDKKERHYVFEVGGEDKDYTQIADIPNSYILADNMEYTTGHKLPLWLLGFIY